MKNNKKTKKGKVVVGKKIIKVDSDTFQLGVIANSIIKKFKQ